MSKNEQIDKRVLEVADYIISHNSTVRATAKHFGVSKSTVHKDVAERLQYISLDMYSKADAVLQKNKAERHLRGGNATREKYLNMEKIDTL